MRDEPQGGGEALELFRSLPGDLAPRDVQDLMAYPFFALAKTPRMAPIGFQTGDITVRVEGTPPHGIATIWDADVLIWAASQIVEARDAGLPTSRAIVTTPFEILRFIRRGTSARDYQRLRAALDRLQSTTVLTSLRQPERHALHRFSWLNEWRAPVDENGRATGLELVLPDWFYAALLDERLVLRLDPAYFHLTGGIERWLYRVVRKHAGSQPQGWQFDFRHLYRKSGSLARYSDFALDLRRIAARDPLPGYQLSVERWPTGLEILRFAPRRDPRSLASVLETLPFLQRAGQDPEDKL